MRSSHGGGSVLQSPPSATRSSADSTPGFRSSNPSAVSSKYLHQQQEKQALGLAMANTKEYSRVAIASMTCEGRDARHADNHEDCTSHCPGTGAPAGDFCAPAIWQLHRASQNSPAQHAQHVVHCPACMAEESSDAIQPHRANDPCLIYSMSYRCRLGHAVRTTEGSTSSSLPRICWP